MAAISSCISISSSAATAAISPSTTSSLSSSFSSSKSFFFTSGPSFPSVKSNTRRSSSSTKKGLSCNCLFGLGMPELVVIAGVAALVFGPKKLPEVGRSIGKTVKSFQQAAKEFESELKKDPAPVGDPPAQKLEEVGNKEEKDVELPSMKES